MNNKPQLAPWSFIKAFGLELTITKVDSFNNVPHYGFTARRENNTYTSGWIPCEILDQEAGEDRPLIGRSPDHFIASDNLEGSNASYAKVGGKWYSVNGTCDRIDDIRWSVSVGSPLHMKLDQEIARIFGLSVDALGGVK